MVTCSEFNIDQYKSYLLTAADLGMFSMFGRTGAPTKRGPHKRIGKFLHAG